MNFFGISMVPRVLGLVSSGPQCEGAPALYSSSRLSSSSLRVPVVHFDGFVFPDVLLSLTQAIWWLHLLPTLLKSVALSGSRKPSVSMSLDFKAKRGLTAAIPGRPVAAQTLAS